MERRKFLSAATGASIVGASALAAPAIASGHRELKMVTTWPKNFPGLGTGAQRLADDITAMTDGQLTVKLYGAGELVPPFESFDAVSGGSADMYHGAEYYWQGKSKAFNFFTAVPFGLTANEMDAWLHWGGGQQLWDELSSGFNIKPFAAGNTGVQMGGWFNKEINTIED
ncbi:MAG: ABC transporter substrate-binding protein, partial [Rhodospirillales bacterium]|nr:ABC transporter substrate-binding protein [Rhodospirillales bacterium]